MLNVRKIVNGVVTEDRLDGGTKIVYMEGDFGDAYASAPTLPELSFGDMVITKNTNAGETDIYRQYLCLGGTNYIMAKFA